MMQPRKMLVCALVLGCLIDLVVGQAPTMMPSAAPSFNTTSPTAMPTNQPTLDPFFEAPPCFDNTTVLYQAMLRANSFIAEEYILCPDTTITVGDFDADGDCCINGDYSFFIRSRSTIKCGADGRLENNCTIVSGNTHIFYIGAIFDDAVANGVRLQGITFRDAKFISSALANRGDITFDNCVWEDMGGVATVFAAYSPPVNNDDRRLVSTERILLEEAGIDMEDPHAIAKHLMSRKFLEEWTKREIENAERARALEKLNGPRQLQAAFTMEITYNNCIFRNNRQGSTTQGGIPVLGTFVALTPFNPTLFNNCDWIGNLFDGSDGNQNGYAIQTVGSPITVNDCCFIDNSFIGFGPVQAFGDAQFEFNRNHATEDDLIICDFAATSEDFVPESERDVNCLTYDLESCRGPERVFAAPTSAPTKVSGAPPSTDSHQLVRSATVASLVMWALALYM